jgi:hypothetical protein
MKLRIHHFFDIIRDFGSGKDFFPHPYLHSYHKIANIILKDPIQRVKIVIGTDSVCEGCIKLKEHACTDIIIHRKDFTGKEEFNNYLDARIMEVCGIEADTVTNTVSLIKVSGKYIDNIHYIYSGNDKSHTEMRKLSVIKGVDNYIRKHGIITSRFLF